MSDLNRDDRVVHNDDEHVPPEQVADAHDADGTTGRVAGTGSGAIAGGLVGSAAAGPVGTVVGAVAGGALGEAAGNAAHKVGDDHDDVNVETASDGQLGRASGTGAGALSGGIVGGAAGGPVGAVVGAVAGGILGAAAGDGAKDMGGNETSDPAPDVPVSGFTSGTTTDSSNLPGVQTGGTTTAGADTRGISEKAADAVTGDRIDDKDGWSRALTAEQDLARKIKRPKAKTNAFSCFRPFRVYRIRVLPDQGFTRTGVPILVAA